MSPGERRATDDALAEDGGSSPCMMPLVDPVSGTVSDDDLQQQRDLKRWRTVERQRLIALRRAIPAAERRGLSDRIARELDRQLGDLSGRIVAAYLPFRGEPDLRAWIEELPRRGATAALPVVVAPRSPLEFRTWGRGKPLRPGVWKIPVPAGGTAVTPDVLIAPVVGYDAACYRLGHGGGYYDRTLAALPCRPRIVGVGYERLALRTIFPQAYDVPMDMIVTEAGVSAR